MYLQTDLNSSPIPISEGTGGDTTGPMISPDGDRIAFEAPSRGIYICSLETPPSCVSLPIDIDSAVRPRWHPASGELAFVRYLAEAGHEDSDIMVTTESHSKAQLLISQTGIQDYPAFSPDGRQLAYSSGQTISLRRGGVQVVQQLWVMRLDTGVARLLIPESHRDVKPDWSPSGRHIAFASDRTGQFEIWVVNSKGEGLRQVTSGTGIKTWPAWSPDGKSIMFTLADKGKQGLWIIDIDGSGLRSFKPFGENADVQLRDADWQ